MQNKSGMQIAQADFSFDRMKTTQEYLMYFKEFSCNQAENMQARCVPRFIQRFRNCGGRTLMKRPPCGFQSPVLSPTPLQRRSRKESAASPALGAGWRKLPRGRGAPLRAASPPSKGSGFAATAAERCAFCGARRAPPISANAAKAACTK